MGFSQESNLFIHSFYKRSHLCRFQQSTEHTELEIFGQRYPQHLQCSSPDSSLFFAWYKSYSQRKLGFFRCTHGMASVILPDGFIVGQS